MLSDATKDLAAVRAATDPQVRDRVAERLHRTLGAILVAVGRKRWSFSTCTLRRCADSAIWRSIRSVVPVDSKHLRRRVFLILKRLLVDEYRHRHSQQQCFERKFSSGPETSRHGSLLDVCVSPEVGPVESVSLHESYQTVRRAMDRLDDLEQLILYLRVMRELPWQEIHELTGKPISTLHDTLGLAIERLRWECGHVELVR